MTSLASHQETLLVWLLDDDLSVLKATSRLLDSSGWHVRAFAEPADFLENSAVHPPDIAVIDIGLPGMNGLEVQNRLAAISPDTRVVILTSKDDPAMRAMAMKAGASGYFVKGVEKAAFLSGIEEAAKGK